MGECSVDGCPRPAWARGWCGTHYRRWQRTGSTADEARRPTPPRVPIYTPEEARDRHTAASARYRERNREAILAANTTRARDPSYRERMRRARNAKNAVQRAVKRGRLIRPETCQQCAGPGPIEAAHQDYSRPLDVRWLCQKCHRAWDAADPKTRE